MRADRISVLKYKKRTNLAFLITNLLQFYEIPIWFFLFPQPWVQIWQTDLFVFAFKFNMNSQPIGTSHFALAPLVSKLQALLIVVPIQFHTSSNETVHN